MSKEKVTLINIGGKQAASLRPRIHPDAAAVS
jgi:hypothetical protein